MKQYFHNKDWRAITINGMIIFCVIFLTWAWNN